MLQPEPGSWAPLSRTLGADVSRAAVKVPWVGPRVALRLHRYGLGGSTTTWAELADLAEYERPDVLSVDVFDTCVVRDLLGDTPIELAIKHRTNGDGPAELAAQLEGLLCRPVPEVAKALARVRAAGTQIVFLSDTDRSSELLRDILQRSGILVDGDELVASSEAGATKSDGNLFARVWPDIADPGADPARQIWHVGNNLWSDVTMAQQAGLRAFAIVDTEPTRYEAAMAARPESAGPAVASAARNARLDALAATGEADAGHGAELEVLGAEVAGQAFSGFLLWMAELSRQEGLGQLAFLSRDGELPLEMALAMPADHWNGMPLTYLHTSRWQWLLAGPSAIGLEVWLEAGTFDATSFIHAHRHKVSFKSLLGRIGLERADLSGHNDLAHLDHDEPLPIEYVPAWDDLLADPAIGEVILARSHERKALIVDYVHGLGFADRRVGLVDVGWRGRLAWITSAVVREATGHEPIHFHFGGDKVLPEVDKLVDIRRFAFDGITPPHPITNPTSCVETITASGAPRLLGYQRMADGSVQPVHEERVTAVHHPDRTLLWNGAIRTAANLPSRQLLEQLGTSTESLGAEANRVLSLWWTEPVRPEVEAIQGLLFEGDDHGDSIAPLVAPYSPLEISAVEKKARQWQQGSAAISPATMKPVIWLYRQLEALRAKARSGPSNLQVMAWLSSAAHVVPAMLGG